MEAFVVVALVIGVAWFAVPRISKRRRAAEDDAYASGGFGMGMLSWLPAWMIIGGAMHGSETRADPGAHGGLPGDFGGGDPGAGLGGGDLGGGDLGGGGFGGA